MKFATYLLLIGAAAANSCISDDITKASAKVADETKKMADIAAKKTPEVEAFQKKLKEKQDHLNDMIAAETIAKVGKVQAEITTASTNKQAAEVAITQLLAEAGNADYNKILVDSAAQYKLVEAAEKEYHMALNSCVGTEVQKYLDEMMTAKKTEDKYDAMTADQKKAWDEKHAAMLDKKADHMADLRMAAEYHKMDDASKAMFDKMFIAQQKVMKDNKSKMDDMINKDGMDKAKWDALSDEEKAKMKDKMKDMRDHVGDMMDKRGKADFEMMAKAKYFNMNKDQQKVFDEKMGERRGQSQEDMQEMLKKMMLAKGKMSDMTDDERKAAMKDMKEMFDMKSERDGKFDDHDFMQRMKNGYFDKMGKGERDEYDKHDKKMRDERKGNMGKMDDKMMEFKKSGGFDKMTDDQKKNFMGMYMFQMGGNMQQMMKDREDDDDMRKRMGYFKQNESGRASIDKEIEFQQGKRSMGRMPVMQSESGSVCYPSQYYDGDEYRGGKDGKMHDKDDDGEGPDKDDMMGKMMKDGMKEMEKDGPMGMMKGGMKGMGGMMDKMNGMEGMMDKMGRMDAKDQEEMKDKLMAMKKGDMSGMMKGGMDGMKKGMEDMMKMKFNSMMENGDKDDMMKKMGGKEGMMEMMGMIKGKDRDGNDMKKKFDSEMQRKGGQSHGPMTKEKRDEFMKGPDGKEKKSFNGGCAEQLCCGHVLEYGIWKEQYFCYDQYAQLTEDNFRFKCVEGMASKLAGAALSVAAAVFMMQ